MIAGIVLAAGKSERMGSPKALLPVSGRTFIEQVTGVATAAGLSPVVVVLGHHQTDVEQAVKFGADVAVIRNPDYAKGMITSFQAGIRAVPHVEGAAFFLVDHPGVETRVVRALLSAAWAQPILVPVYLGRRGHPLLLHHSIMEEVLALPASVGANTVIHRDPRRVLEVCVDSPGVLVDVDTPEQFREWSKENP